MIVRIKWERMETGFMLVFIIIILNDYLYHAEVYGLNPSP